MFSGSETSNAPGSTGALDPGFACSVMRVEHPG